MSDDLSIRGAVAETTVPDLFRSITRAGETAIVTLEDSITASIYFRNSHIVFATSSDPDMGLPELLLESGEIQLAQYNTVAERMLAADRAGAVVCELGYIDADGLVRALERQANRIVRESLQWRGGTYTIEFVDDFPPGIIDLQLPTDQLLLEGVRAIQHWSLISRGTGRLERLLAQCDGAEVRSLQMELTADEMHILELLEEPQTVQALCTRSYLAEFATCRTICALLTVGLVKDATSAGGEKRQAEFSEYELEAKVERYNTLFQTIFGIVFQKIGDHIYDFMDRVVAQLSPVTLPYLSGLALVNESRLDFDQLLNNVIASGSTDHHAAVETVLNDFLYAWIVEIKREFGPGMEAEVVRLAESLGKP